VGSSSKDNQQRGSSSSSAAGPIPSNDDNSKQPPDDTDESSIADKIAAWEAANLKGKLEDEEETSNKSLNSSATNDDACSSEDLFPTMAVKCSPAKLGNLDSRGCSEDDDSSNVNVVDPASTDMRAKVEAEKKQREHMLMLNQALAKEVLERTKSVAPGWSGY
jgi:hypothetical protein